MVTKRLMKKKNDTIVEAEREHTIEKMEEEQEKKNANGVQHDNSCDKMGERNSESDLMHNRVQQEMDDKNAKLVEK